MILPTEYAKALFMLSEEDGVSDSLLESVLSVKQLLSKNPDYIKLLDSPAVDKDERLSLIDASFGSAERMLVNLLKILAEKRLVFCFGRIADEYKRIYDEAKGIETATAITTQPMSDRQMNALTAMLETITGKTVILKNEIDPTLIGGISLRFSGKQFDGSIKARLDAFADNLGKLIV